MYTNILVIYKTYIMFKITAIYICNLFKNEFYKNTILSHR